MKYSEGEILNIFLSSHGYIFDVKNFFFNHETQFREPGAIFKKKFLRIIVVPFDLQFLVPVWFCKVMFPVNGCEIEDLQYNGKLERVGKGSRSG